MNISVKNELHYPAVLAKRILLILGLYAMARVYFFIVNRDLFPETSSWDFFKCAWYGIRFDICAIIYTNLVFILLHILPLNWRDRRWYQVICKILFYLVNASLFILMVGDAEYYQHSFRHATTELKDFVHDFIPLLPAYLVDFWYLLPIAALAVILTEFLYRKTKKIPSKKNLRKEPSMVSPKRNFWIQLMLFPIMGGLVFLGLRGGFQAYPLAPIHAGKYGPPSWTPLIINTPFSVIHSFFHRSLQPLNYFNEKELAANFSYVHVPGADSLAGSPTQTPQNVFIIIMESFSAEYTGAYLAEKSATPFLDSLARQSMVFTQMNANGMRSVDGIPAILAGIPAQMEESFLASIYQSNNYKGLADYYKEMGYSTSFFHGGHNGTFNLDNFAYTSGFEKYYGKNQYNGKKEDVSHWGIFDLPFFKFTGEEVGKMKPPFLATLFSLSSHHPYEIPAEYAQTHPQHPDKLLNSVLYADYALKMFFEQVKKQSWFNHTLFIITADHCGPAITGIGGQKINRLHVPLLFYHPTDSFFRGTSSTPVQHIDIMPTLLDYVHYPKPYGSYGTNVFKPGQHYAYGRVGGFNYITDGVYVLEMLEEKSTGLYLLNPKREFTINLMKEQPNEVNRLSTKLKAFMQTYVNTLVENKMLIQ
jgi:phosphoglycerol transferase MdoB-like AlkP superfamily enzyme